MYIYDENYKFIFCDFEFSDQSAKKAAVYSTEHSKHIDGLFVNLLNCYQSGTISSRADCMSILYRIYSALFKCTEQGAAAKNQDDRIDAAKLYIDSHYSETALSIAFLAEQAGISEVYFRKLFKKKHHTSPAKYLITVRLNNARKLMQYAFLSIEDCALQSGFSSAQYFCRAFKKEIGISPGEYKKSIYAKF
jgi:AraC-like DNA-binding protein